MITDTHTAAASIRKLVWLAILAGLTAACSSGGGGDEPSAVAEVETGPVASPEEPTTPSEESPEPEPLPEPEPEEPALVPLKVWWGTDLNSKSSPELSLNPGGPGGSPNQSLRAGDVLQGYEEDDLLIGGLGVDVLLGYNGNDVLIGGTEDFNSSVDGDDKGADNRDRAFGGYGDDVFIWSPGDGSDFFDGGEGTDVVIFGVLGEARDADGSTAGAPFFNVSPPGSEGSQDFDGIYLQPESNLPLTRVSASPGFCSVIDRYSNPTELDRLQLDNIVRFSLRGVANDFDNGLRDDDDGLRVAVSLKNTEFLVCTRRQVMDGGGDDNIQVLDLRYDIPVEATLDDLPPSVRAQIE